MWPDLQKPSKNPPPLDLLHTYASNVATLANCKYVAIYMRTITLLQFFTYRIYSYWEIFKV